MARTNGGITGKRNVASFGKCKVTSFTSSGNLSVHKQVLELLKALVVAGGGGGGGDPPNGAAAGGGGAGGLLD